MSSAKGGFVRRQLERLATRSRVFREQSIDALLKSARTYARRRGDCYIAVGAESTSGSLMPRQRDGSVVKKNLGRRLRIGFQYVKVPGYSSGATLTKQRRPARIPAQSRLWKLRVTSRNDKCSVVSLTG